MDQAKYCQDLLGIQSAPADTPKVKLSKSKRPSRRIFKTVPKIFTKDPIKKHKKEERKEILYQKKLAKELELAAIKKAEKEAQKCPSLFTPSFGTRLDIKAKGEIPLEERSLKYQVPLPRPLIKKMKEDRENYIKMLNFCDFDSERIEAPPPPQEIKLKQVMKVDSPKITPGKIIVPKKPSFFPSDIYPEPPTIKELELIQPSSGIFLNEKSPQADIMSSFELMLAGKSRATYQKELEGKEAKPCLTKTKAKKKRKKRKSAKAGGEKKKKKKVAEKSGLTEGNEETELATHDLTSELSPKQIAEYLEKEDEILRQYGEGEDGEIPLEPLQDTYLTRMFRKEVSQVSKATSLHEKDLLGFEVSPDYELEECPFVDRVLQKFRRDSELERYKKPKRKIKRGTLESHSFTNINQTTLKEFYYGVVYGNIHQGDDHFLDVSRNYQGICMPVAAYCFAVEFHPSKWTDQTMDMILELGDRLYRDSVENLHLHETSRELKAEDLHKFLYLGEDKFRFVVEDPFVSGSIRSVEKNVYNITKGLQIFFAANHAGILQTTNLDVLVYKDKYFYLFDARPRTKDLYPDENGNATLTIVYDIPSLVTIFLDRSKLGNWPFIISKVSVMKKLKLNEEEDEEDVKEGSNYNILSPNKAVVQGSFDLADKCFGFSRNKQSLTMAVIALIYSRITPPNSWHRRTIDKIMVIGNQLYLECAEQELIMEMNLDDLPALFTIGPYLVEIFIYANRVVDVLHKKGKCMLQDAFECFFTKNTNAILQIGKSTLAVWQQRNMIYCFDPYSRNNQGTMCRNGVGCVSMNTDLETLVQTISTNFPDSASIFYIHALKVLKIHRDPAMSRFFPKTSKMDDISPETLKKYKMKKSKKRATEKPVTIDLTQTSIKRLLPGESPEPSIHEVSSDVDSLTKEQLPSMHEPCHVLKKLPPTKMAEYADVIDLDSPSLSDTQIEPPRPLPDKCLEEITLMDLDSFVLTQEEIEMIEVPEGEGEGQVGGRGGRGEGEGEGEGGKDLDELDNTYLAMNEFAQVHPDSLDSYHSKISQMVNTEVTAAFLPISHKVLKPTNVLNKKTLKRCIELNKLGQETGIEANLEEHEVTMEEELMKDSNFVDLPDDSQLIRGSQNIGSISKNMDLAAPYVCIVAATVAKKYSIPTWSSDIVDYVLTGGDALYGLANFRFDQSPKFEIPKISLGHDNYRVLVDYLYDNEFSQLMLERALANILFTRIDIGIVVTAYYSCAVFYKNHLYYLYDCYGNNEVGLSEGPYNQGTATFARFKSLEHMVQRMVYNKTKREKAESFQFQKFLLFSVKVETIRLEALKKQMPDTLTSAIGEGEGEDEDASVQDSKKTKDQDGEKLKPKNIIGFKMREGFSTLVGSKAVKGRSNISEGLKEDHFVCVCAGLMLSCCPLEKWDTRKMDYVIDHGVAIFAHADNLNVVEKRIIKNILIDNYFLDVIVRRKEVPYEESRTFNLAAAYMMRKNNQVIVQFPNCSYVLCKYKEFWYLFDPYPCQPNGKKDDKEEGVAAWTKLWDLRQVTKKVKENIISGAENYSFYRFEITSIKKAPKKVVLEQKLMLYQINKEQEPEKFVKLVYEDKDWLEVDPIPWSQRKKKSACGFFRCKREYMWNNWDVEYPNDLYSIVSSINQFSNKFSDGSRGKQTLCNCVCAIGMTVIYDLTEWNTPIMDCILTNGDNYFLQSTQNIDVKDYELSMDDLISNCTIFPYNFKVDFYPVVDGTMFIQDPKKYNLYKALRYFFENYERRSGILCVMRGEIKRFVAFGKIQDKEYFMFDSQSFGPPMFLERESKAYALRCTTLPRLLHVLTVCLRGGDFFIYNVECKDFSPIDSK